MLSINRSNSHLLSIHRRWSRRLDPTLDNWTYRSEQRGHRRLQQQEALATRYPRASDKTWCQFRSCNVLADQIELELRKAPVILVVARETINDALDHHTTSIEQRQHSSIDELNEVALAVDDLRQTVNSALSKVFVQLNALHSKIDILELKVNILESQSVAVKTWILLLIYSGRYPCSRSLHYHVIIAIFLHYNSF